MQNIQPFNFEKNQVRVIQDDNGKPLFVAKDVAKALGYNWQVALVKHVPEEWKGVTQSNTPSGVQRLTVLTEQGLYFFTARSDKPKALPFQKWLAGEVLPSIRKTGGYQSQPAFQVPQSMAEALRLAADQAEQIEEQQRQIEQARPSVEFVERYVDVGTTKTIRETAKILGLPEKAFIQAMIEDKILYRQSGNLLPHQKHHAAERFDVKTGERNGHAYTQTRVTSAGIGYLANFYGHWIGEVAA
ncbi:BRO family protein [Halomonas sp. MS1]|nr:phage antirepressor KilAC domain-containing protein [Halomonas sp. MS1]UTD55926.1 phage antirepressor KilAC domain-containing protein [Halomonas sp. MS1]